MLIRLRRLVLVALLCAPLSAKDPADSGVSAWRCGLAVAGHSQASSTLLSAAAVLDPMWTPDDLRELGAVLDHATVRDLSLPEIEFIARKLHVCTLRQRDCCPEAFERATGRKLPRAAVSALHRWLAARVSAAIGPLAFRPGSNVAGLTVVGDLFDLSVPEARTVGALAREGLRAVAITDPSVRELARIPPDEPVADLIFATTEDDLVITEVKLALDGNADSPFEKAIAQLTSTVRSLVANRLSPARIARLEVSVSSPLSLAPAPDLHYGVGASGELVLLTEAAGGPPIPRPVVIAFAGRSLSVRVRFFQR